MNVTLIHFLIIAGLQISFTTPANGASDYCAFEIKVSSPTGSPLEGVPVAMIQRDNKEFGREVRTDHNGRASLCDAPMQQVTIIVGFDMCGAVAIKGILASWPVTEHLFLTYEPRGCNHFTPPASCTILLRLRDEQNRPVSGATWITGQGPTESRSDEYGRIFNSVPEGGKLEGLVSKDGYSAVKISESCTHDGDYAIERRVTIRSK